MYLAGLRFPLVARKPEESHISYSFLWNLHVTPEPLEASGFKWPVNKKTELNCI